MKKSETARLKPRVYTVGTAHLDTSWHWPFETTVEEYIPQTLTRNFELFEKYPEYVFSFEGAYRYALTEEYYPELFEKLKAYVAGGRWRVSGSSWENGDVNIPSPEALFRNILLGNNYFDETFGKRSKDIYLPDCFGFGLALPGVAAHANLLGFSTQKLGWGSANPVRDGLCRWAAPDGSFIFAAPDSGEYGKTLKKARRYPSAVLKLAYQKRHGLFPGMQLLHGVGDQGGAPKEPSVQTVCREIGENESASVDVLSTGSDQIFRDIAATPKADQMMLPVFTGEWLLCDHGTGCYTSRVWSKRWNRKAEQLADAAERVSCFAGFLGRMAYPQEELNTAWKRVIAHQFHDDMTGTSCDISYVRNWNDLYISQLQFAEAQRMGVSAIAGAMDASFAVGRCAAVCNAGQWPRAEALRVELPHRLRGSAVRVVDAEGHEMPSQPDAKGDAVIFLAAVPPMSVSLFDIQISELPCAIETGLRVSETLLENKNLRVKIDANGDIASLFDKRRGIECLRAPVRLALFDFDGANSYPQWELYWPELKGPAAEYPMNPEVRVVERGAARAAIEIVRKARGSTFRQAISLDAAGDCVRVHNEIDWRSLRSLCKVEIPCAAGCEEATYDIGFGTVRRGNSRRDLYEVPAQQWADISDAEQGLTVLSDSKTGWDKPDDHTLRMTAVYSPRAHRYGNAHLLDWGRNIFDFGLYPHEGDWRNGSMKAGATFNQPLSAFWLQERGTPGAPTTLRFGRVSDGVILRCMKKAEYSDEVIIRVQEAHGVACPNGEIRLGNGITAFREVYASEEPREVPPNCANLRDGTLQVSFEPYEIRTFAVSVAQALRAKAVPQQPVPVSCHRRITSRQGQCGEAEFYLPAEQFPKEITAGGVTYILANPENDSGTADCTADCVSALPTGKELRLLMASLGEDQEVTFLLNGQPHTRTAWAARQPVGMGDLPGIGLSGVTKPAAPALEFCHLHDGEGKDIIGAKALFFSVALPLPPADPEGGPCALTLPQAEDIVILAATVLGEASALPGSRLTDTLPLRPAEELVVNLTPKQSKAKDAKMRWRSFRNRMAFVRRYLKLKAAVHLRW